MKQYTTQDQTTKLIELGFEKPSSIASVEPIYGMGGISVAKAYNIGELIQMLQTVKHSCLLIYNLGFGHKVLFKKLNGRWEYQYREIGEELIDLLFNAIVKLKEEGVI